MMKATAGIIPRIICVVVLIAAGCHDSAQLPDGSGAASRIPATNELRRVLDPSYSRDAQLQPSLDMKRAALEAGNGGIPLLEEALNDPVRQGLAVVGLAYLGGPKSTELLRRHYEKTGAGKSGLCFALASTGTPEDRKFLIESLVVEDTLFGNDWYTRACAAYSLGVLRAREAIPALERTARKKDGRFDSAAAEAALRWIQEDPPSVPHLSNPSERDRVILAVLGHAIPSTDRSDVFFEEQASRLWENRGAGWRVRTVTTEPEDTPSISFDVFITNDGQRALCAVGLHFGHLDAIGYDYVLRKDNDTWKVVGLILTWVS